MQLFQKLFLSKPNLEASTQPVICLLYDRLPTLNLEVALQALDSFEPMAEKPLLRIEQDLKTGSMLFATVSWEAHTIHIGGLPSPLPPAVVERCIIPSPWNPAWKEMAQSHGANLILLYEGKAHDTVEQYLALYKVAAALRTDGTLAVVNEPAWTCHPVEIVDQILDPHFLPMVRHSPPLVYWTGLLSVDWQEEQWLITRGNRLFRLPELAWPVDELTDPMEVLNTLHEIALYFYFEGKDLHAGDLLNIDEQNYFTFKHLGEARASLESHGATLVVERVHADEAETLMEQDTDNQETY
ncbi:MAG: hypothetical protein LW884_05800 [Bacteroidetes bacterium]|jgi:hypothetical protein|nr:hypothetical protein [Bacteroidota bacterium]